VGGGGRLGFAHSWGSENRSGQCLCFKFGVGLQPISADHSDSQS